MKAGVVVAGDEAVFVIETSDDGKSGAAPHRGQRAHPQPVRAKQPSPALILIQRESWVKLRSETPKVLEDLMNVLALAFVINSG